LLNKGAFVKDLVSVIHGNALYEPVLNGHVEVARLLLDHDARVLKIMGMCGTPQEPIARRCSEALVRFLLVKGPDVNVETGHRPLITATSRAVHNAMVRMLIEYGGVGIGKSQLSAALHDVMKLRYDGLVRLLLEDRRVFG
jgi:hypothetical protein